MPFPNPISTPQQPHGGGGSAEDIDWPDPMKAGRSPTLVTNLSEQIGPYYKDVEGGYEEVIRKAQKAMGERTDWQKDQMKGFPKYRPHDLERPVAVFRGGLPDDIFGAAYAPSKYRPQYQDDAIEMGIKGSEMPTDIPEVGYPTHLAAEASVTGSGRYGGPNRMHFYDDAMSRWRTKEPPPAQGTLEHELGHMAFAPREGQPEWKDDYKLMDHLKPWYYFYNPLNWKEGLEGVPQFEESTRDRWKRPFPTPQIGRMAEFPTDWHYMTTPSELDTRLGQIKRAYSVAHPGKYIQTTEDAQNAWNWWREKQQRENPGGYMGDWDKDMMDALNNNPRQLNLLIQRLRELVQNQPGGLEQALIG